jgi:hypothetical protein
VLPTVTLAAGVPVMVGARLTGGVLVGACTVSVNCSCALAWPSLTLMMMAPVLPMSAVVGVPETRPVAGVNVSHVGRLVMLYVSGSSLASSPTGANVNTWPTMAVVAGVPTSVGATLA